MASQHHQLIGTEVSSNPGKVITQTASAWHQFVSFGSFIKDKPRQIITQSWEACSPMRLIRKFRKSLKNKISVVPDAGREVLDSYTRLMKKSEHVLVLGVWEMPTKSQNIITGLQHVTLQLLPRMVETFFLMNSTHYL